jgi:hypothetical protein
MILFRGLIKITISEETRNKDAISEETRNNSNRRGLANSTHWNNCDFEKFSIWNEITDLTSSTDLTTPVLLVQLLSTDKMAISRVHDRRVHTLWKNCDFGSKILFSFWIFVCDINAIKLSATYANRVLQPA